MPKHRPMPPMELLRKHLSYDPETGDWTWINNIVNNRAIPVKIGAKAGSLSPIERNRDQGYITIQLARNLYRAHRLAWYYMTGSDPGEKEIDHIDGNRANNKFDNLRLVERANQSWNQKKPSTNKSGYKGLCWDKGHKKWMGLVTYKGVIHKRRFKSRKEAIQWIYQKRLELHGEYARHS